MHPLETDNGARTETLTMETDNGANQKRVLTYYLLNIPYKYTTALLTRCASVPTQKSGLCRSSLISRVCEQASNIGGDESVSHDLRVQIMLVSAVLALC